MWSLSEAKRTFSHEVRRPVVYPGVAEKLADLAARIATNDAAIERINSKLPKDATWIAGAERVTRKLRSFYDGTADIPRITRHLRLPAFRYAALDPYSWPPARK